MSSILKSEHSKSVCEFGVQMKHISPIKSRQIDTIEYYSCRRTNDVEAGAR